MLRVFDFHVSAVGLRRVTSVKTDCLLVHDSIFGNYIWEYVPVRGSRRLQSVAFSGVFWSVLLRIRGAFSADVCDCVL